MSCTRSWPPSPRPRPARLSRSSQFTRACPAATSRLVMKSTASASLQVRPLQPCRARRSAAGSPVSSYAASSSSYRRCCESTSGCPVRTRTASTKPMSCAASLRRPSNAASTAHTLHMRVSTEVPDKREPLLSNGSRLFRLARCKQVRCQTHECVARYCRVCPGIALAQATASRPRSMACSTSPRQYSATETFWRVPASSRDRRSRAI